MIKTMLIALAGAPVVALGLSALMTGRIARRAERQVPASGKFVDVPGARLHYVDMGSGPAIVMIHGLAAQLHNFTYGVAGLLSGRYRVICVDRPGAGYSTVTSGPQPGLGGQAEIIARFIEALELDRPLIVGHSLGGAVALRLALDHPQRVGALALLSPLTQRQDEIPDAFAKMVIPSNAVRRLISRTLGIPIGRLGAKRTQAKVFAPEPCPDDFETKGGNALLFRPGSFFAASSEVSAGSQEVADMAQRYPGLKVPVPILFAEEDRILDPRKHGAAITWASPMVTNEPIGGGHMFPITQPERTAEWIDGRARALATAREIRSAVPQEG